MNRGELKTYIYDILQADITHGNWPATLVERNIQDGQMHVFSVCAEAHRLFFETSTLLDTVQGVSEINLPTNTHRVLSLERMTGNDPPYFVDKIDYKPEIIESLRDTRSFHGDAEVYWTIGVSRLGFVNPFDQTESGRYRLRYIFRPATMAQDSHVPFQAVAGTGGAGKDNLVEWHDIIALYALEACFAQEESAIAAWTRSRRNERSLQLMSYLRQVNVQEPKFINKTVNAFDGQGWY